MYLSYAFIFKERIYPLLLSVIAVITFGLFSKVLFLQPFKVMLFYGLPSKGDFKSPAFFYLISFIIVLYPVLIKTIFFRKSNQLRKASKFFIQLILFFVILSFILFKWQYNSQAASLLRLEKYLFSRNWDKLIKYQEKNRSADLLSQYYYTIALSEKGLLCERLFHSPQNYGPGVLLIPWDSQAGISNIFRGVYFFYTMGLINEAHRWAFESMVTQGFHPENIKLLIKTNLINGYYLIAEKYINILKKTFHYRKLAKRYEQMLNNPDMIKSDPELGEKLRLQPRQDFSIQIKNPQSNVLLMLQANPENEKAFEYKMAWYLLEKNPGAVVKEIPKFKELGYKQIPKHIEEAALVFGAVSGQIVMDYDGLTISKEAQKRFSQYERTMAIFQSNMKAGLSIMKKSFSNTLWFYLDFN